MAKRYIAVIMAMFVAVSMFAEPLTANASSYEVVKQYSFDVSNSGNDRVVYEYYITDGTSEIAYQGTQLTSYELIKNLMAKGETVTIRAKISMPLTKEQSIYLSSCDRVSVSVNGTSQNNWVGVAGYFSTVGFWDSASAYSYVMLGDKDNQYNGYVSNLNSVYKTTASTVYIEPYTYSDMMPKETNDYERINVEYVFTLNNLKADGVQFNLYFSNININVNCEYLNATSIDSVNSNITNNLIEDKTNQIIDKQDTIIDKQDTIIDKIQSGFASVGESVKTGVTNAVTEMFVPDEQAVEDFFTNMNDMEEEHLKPIAQLKDTVSSIEQTLFNPNYDAQIVGDLAPVAGYINTVQGDGVFIFPSYEMKLPEGNFTLWEDYVIDVGATLDDMGLSWIPTVTQAICIALFTWRFLIMVLRWLMKVTDNPTFGQWADMLASFDFNYKTGW